MGFLFGKEQDMGADGNSEMITSGAGMNRMEISGAGINGPGTSEAERNGMGIRKAGMNGTVQSTRLTEDEFVKLISTAAEGTVISIDLAEGDRP